MYLAQTWIEQNGWVLDLSIGFVGIAVGALVTVLTYLKSRERRILDYRVENRLDIIPSATSKHTELKVTYNGVVLDQPRIMTMRIMNSGNRAVVREEFVDPISFVEGEEDPSLVKFVEGVIVEGLPPEIVGDVLVEVDGRKVMRIAPKLMNPKDYFIVQLTYEGELGWMTECRFIGQTRRMQFREKPLDLFQITAIWVATLFVSGFLFFIGGTGTFWNKVDPSVDLSPAYISLGASAFTLLLGGFFASGLIHRKVYTLVNRQRRREYLKYFAE
ncbi:hypothetical protein [Mycolicibacterium sp. PDY-3]|uniref:hypothetical protein n=1 Tax=Mycolicibacterium sp. PDY-3 TaxID=3376069 RepID=UPI00378BCFF1